MRKNVAKRASQATESPQSVSPFSSRELTDRKGKRMRSKVLLVITAALCTSIFAASAAHSAPGSFSFTVDATQGVFGDPGTTIVLDTHVVDASLVGRACDVTVDPHNNDSVREGTDLLVSSNGVTLTVANAEHRAGDAAPAVLGNLTLGGTVSLSLRFGPEGAASVGATVIVDCPDVPTTTNPPTTTMAPGVVISPATLSPSTAVTPGRPTVAGIVVTQPRFTG